jgi:hypothetical protein
MKLNLGCGDQKMDGYINVDLHGDPDVRCDLTVFPWPWSDDSVDEVYMCHFLEHVPDLEKTLLEIHRILKANGIVHFRVPHFRSPFGIWHLHCWAFSVYTPRLFCQKIPYQFGGRRLFKEEKIRINFIYHKIILAPLGLLANLFPVFWDWAGFPISEIEFVGRKVIE